jgi:hypothetical protein
MNDEQRIQINAIREECLAAVECVLVAVQHMREELKRVSEENAELRRIVYSAMDSTTEE